MGRIIMGAYRTAIDLRLERRLELQQLQEVE